jgi:hypothetical protein
MTKIVSLKSVLAALGAVAALGATAAAHAQAAPHTPQVMFDPVGEAPPPPAGLQVVCINAPVDGAPASNTCPVIHWDGYKTWIYSYADNRNSFALVTYDSTGKILRNAEAPGARYIFDVFSDDPARSSPWSASPRRSVVINWSDLPH